MSAYEKRESSLGEPIRSGEYVKVSTSQPHDQPRQPASGGVRTEGRDTEGSARMDKLEARVAALEAALESSRRTGKRRAP